MLRTENLYVLKIFVRLTTIKVVVNSSLEFRIDYDFWYVGH